MGDQLVTDGSPETGADGGKSRPSALSRYGRTFDKMCGYYLSLGMSYHDYWDGDSTMTKYYRDKGDSDRERENFYLWLQATYIYRAMLDVSPVLRAFAKHPKPKPFLSEPIPLKSEQKESTLKQETDNERKMQNGKKAMMAMAASFNNKFLEKQKGEVK